MSSNGGQVKLFKVSKREATRNWRRYGDVVRQLEAMEEKQSAELRATKKALQAARAAHREAEETLGELLDSEDPTIAGVLDDDPTIPQS